MKVHIFGASGSGVSTLGNALADQTNLPYFDTDYFFWEPSDPPFTVKRNPTERNNQLRSELQKHSSWIVGGSLVSWGDEWISAFDVAVFLGKEYFSFIGVRNLERCFLDFYCDAGSLVFGNVVFLDDFNLRLGRL